MSVARDYPARTDSNGRTWYRSGVGYMAGWTAIIELADPSYLAENEHGPHCGRPGTPLDGTPCPSCGEYDEPSGRDDPESISNLMAQGPPKEG